MQSNLDAPGLKRLKRPSGRITCYWVADPELVKAGYPTKTARLAGDHNNPEDFLQMAARCRRLQEEMLEWKAGRQASGNRQAFGTIGWLCDAFETDEESPYRQKRAATQHFYSRYMGILRTSVGEHQYKTVTGRDVRRWHKEWRARIGERGAYACIQTLRRVVSYGCELRDRDAIEFAEVLKHTEFPQPASRKRRPTYEQIVALRKAAHEADAYSVALATTLQFDLGLRQRDVLGEWIRAGDGTREGIMDGDRRWQWGLTWDQIDKDWILKKPTSKSNGREVAEHDLKRYPDVMAELTRIPSDRRVGPVLLNETTGKPWTATRFSRHFRNLARAAGWPDDLYNMDSRAGAVSEAFEAGAAAEDVMKTATHRDLSTTMIYNRGSLEQTARVADLRMARRKREQGNKP